MKLEPLNYRFHADTSTLSASNRGDISALYSIDIHPSGRFATGGADQKARIWKLKPRNAKSGSCVEFLATLSGHNCGSVNTVKFSPTTTGHTLATGGDDSKILIWQLHSNEPPIMGYGDCDDEGQKETWRDLHVLTGHSTSVYDISWSPNGDKLVSCDEIREIIVWDVNKRETLYRTNVHTLPVQGLAWDPCNHLIASQSLDRTVRVFRLKTTKHKLSLTIHKKINSIPLNDLDGDDTTKELKNESNSEKAPSGSPSASSSSTSSSSTSASSASASASAGSFSSSSSAKTSTSSTTNTSTNPTTAGVPSSTQLNPATNPDHTSTGATNASATNSASLPPKPGKEEAVDKMEIDEDEEFEVEKIIDKRERLGKTEYLIQWRGYSQEHDTWENADDCDCDQAIKKFEYQRNKTNEKTNKKTNEKTNEKANESCALPEEKSTSKKSRLKNMKLFLPGENTGFFRRLSWSPDGEFLLTASGQVQDPNKSELEFAAHMFHRADFATPFATFPGFDTCVSVARFSKVFYKNRYSLKDRLIDHPVRMVFAVACNTSVTIYDTEQKSPIGYVGDIHSQPIHDLTWSCDGNSLLVASGDGFCSLVTFEDGELGEKMPLKEVAHALATRAVKLIRQYNKTRPVKIKHKKPKTKKPKTQKKTKKSTDKKPTDKKSTGKKSTDKKPTGKKSTDKKPTGKKPTGKKSTTKTTDSQTTIKATKKQNTKEQKDGSEVPKKKKKTENTETSKKRKKKKENVGEQKESSTGTASLKKVVASPGKPLTGTKRPVSACAMMSPAKKPMVTGGQMRLDKFFKSPKKNKRQKLTTSTTKSQIPTPPATAPSVTAPSVSAPPPVSDAQVHVAVEVVDLTDSPPLRQGKRTAMSDQDKRMMLCGDGFKKDRKSARHIFLDPAPGSIARGLQQPLAPQPSPLVYKLPNPLPNPSPNPPTNPPPARQPYMHPDHHKAVPKPRQESSKTDLSVKPADNENDTSKANVRGFQKLFGGSLGAQSSVRKITPQLIATGPPKSDVIGGLNTARSKPSLAVRRITPQLISDEKDTCSTPTLPAFQQK